MKQQKKVIGYFSTKLTQSEQNYTIVEKETLAILKGLAHFRNIIFNSCITIRTDNANLIYASPLTARMQRWKMQLEEYDYKLEHTKGKDNIFADNMSRLTKITSPETRFQHIISKIYQSQQEIQNNKNKEEKKTDNKSKEWLTDKNQKILIPQTYSKKIINDLHCELSHPGETKLFETIKNYLQTKNMRKIIREVSRECIMCCKTKNCTAKKLLSLFLSIPPKIQTASLLLSSKNRGFRIIHLLLSTVSSTSTTQFKPPTKTGCELNTL